MYKSISINSSRYPELLKQVNKPPKKLFYKGNLNKKILKNTLAVVGSRRMTTYGRRVTERLVFELASKGVTIVSGFMYGVDITAHRTAISAGGRTIAVMPCGIECIHPSYQKSDYQKIIDTGGAIVSEYDGNQQPQIWSYPQRNNIIAGLSRAVLVVEAAQKSGSSITVGMALDYGRQVFAVPGPITSKVSEGTNKHIFDGAVPALNSDVILDFFGLGVIDKHNENIQHPIIKALKDEPLNFDDLVFKVGMKAEKVGSELTMLVLKGVLFEEGGKYYVD